MVTFLVKRLVQALIVMFVISLVAFAIQDNLGDPLRELVGQSVSEAERDALRDEMGLNDPFITKYTRFVGQALQGDLGNSYFFKRPVVDVILDKLGATLELVVGAALIIVVVSIPLGVYAAIHPKSILTKIIMGFSIVGISIPVFLTAIMLMYVFSIELGWLPSYGRGETANWLGWESGFFTLDGLAHLVLPAVSLASIMLPLFIRLVRSEMLEALGTEYVKFARAKGLPENKVYYQHALKNTMLPVVTVGGVQIGTMIAYTILTETVFQWPGMGFLFLEAINRVDTPLITAYVIFVGLIFVVTNTFVDLLYGLINPTVNITGKEA
ncbi:ABC transporter permease [Salinivibrio sp. MA351]|jgi:peptide/nickel transport system permease protein|uniref:ABC transporter permease n=1 Tax=Salinivibrio costicola subsp. alcaliphilus TaxID=272773 RepID=A0ABX3KP57_SALCS|nr:MULTISPECIES: ABC transporter permease [Salinivibrio]NUY57033.1 ABC transporter permease [Salinivibrio sp. EAGSL]OOE88486.1 ABC transporter permease [Salinivibrio sp. AR640]OOE90499.1 ABC transporter permease [Salinivibrio sp. AR647]OOE96391.1 ABC transporter permease [Salinivibrio sp. IB643]OOE96406.1 ABC transporter permease [Salinivibrio sp. MA351]